MTRPNDHADSVAVEAQRRPPVGIQESPRRPSQPSPVHSMTNDLLSMMLSHIIPSSEVIQPEPVPSRPVQATRPRLPVQTTTQEPPRRPTEAPRRPQEVPRRPQDFPQRPSIIEDDFSFDFDVKPLDTPRRPVDTTRRPIETTRRPQEPQRRPVDDDFNVRPQTPPRRPVVNDEFDFDVVPFEFMRQPVTTRATTTTRRPTTTTTTTTTTTEQTTPESVDATTDGKDFENFFDFFPNSMSFFNPPVKMEDSDSTTLPPSENFETTFPPQDLVPLVLEQRPIATTNRPTTSTTTRPTVAPTVAVVNQQKLATTLPSVSEETTTFFSFDDDEFSTMNPMKLLLLAMKKLKEMEQSQNSSFKGNILTR